MSTATEALTRVRYVGQDFQTYENESKEFMSQNYPTVYNDYVDNSMGLALIQLNAYGNMGLAFYMNRRTTDLYMQTAQTPSGIAKISRMLNYTIEGASSSATDVDVTLTDGPYTYPIYIETGFKFNGPNGLVFEYRNPETIVYNPGELTKTFTVYEGETRESVFISDGTENQIFRLVGLPAGKFLVGASIVMLVNNEQWTEQQQIPYALGNFFEVDYVSEPPTIKTGDGIAGTVPEEGKEIRIQYVVGSGRAGRIGSGQIKKEKVPLVIKNQKVKLTINNASPSAGGEDREDLRKVKSLAPKFFQSQDRAISKIDYDVISNTYPGVAKADAQIVRGVSGDVSLNFFFDGIRQSVSGCDALVESQVNTYLDLMYSYLDSGYSSSCGANVVQVAVLQADQNNNYISPASGLLSDLKDHLQSRADLSQTVVTIDGTIYLVECDILVRVKVNQNAVEDDVVDRCRAALQQYDVQPYGLLVLRDYGVSLYRWQLQKSIRDAQVNDSDIDYADIYITEPQDRLNVDGNLIITANEIIVPRTVTIEPIQA